MVDSHVEHAAARADFCRLLAGCYYQPGSEFAEEDVFGSMRTAAMQLDPGLAASCAEMGAAFAAGSLEELLVDYTRLFLNPTGPLAAPYESVWLGGKDPALTQTVMQSVVTFYGEAGFEVDDSFRDLPDHIAAELELFYALLFREARAVMTRDEAERATATDHRRRFVAMHLGRWVGEFAAAVRSGAKTDYFRRLADLTEKFVAQEGARA